MVLAVKDPSANAGDITDLGSILGSRRSPGGGHGNPLQYSYLENPMDRGAWRAIVYGVAKSQTYLATEHIPQRAEEEELSSSFTFPAMGS